ncbi:MAG: HK97 family phage prohead protease [Hyphomicrobiaceae bacterium]|nr:HK97 family phage prohead protease [Hyphomicrobiaceae bacterium]
METSAGAPANRYGGAHHGVLRIAGLASPFGIEDQARDVVAPGAFARSLAARGPGGIRMLFQHDPGQPIGVWDVVREAERGLYVEGRLAAGSARAADIAALLAAGAIDGLSIGFRTVKARREAGNGARRLIEIDLWEVSVVTFPMQREARIERIERLAATERAPQQGSPLAAAMRLSAQRLAS